MVPVIFAVRLAPNERVKVAFWYRERWCTKEIRRFREEFRR